MRAVVFILLLATVAFAEPAKKYNNARNKSPETIKFENDLMASGYDIVVYIGDSYENLPTELRPIGDAIAAFRQVNVSTQIFLFQSIGTNNITLHFRSTRTPEICSK